VVSGRELPVSAGACACLTGAGQVSHTACLAARGQGMQHARAGINSVFHDPAAALVIDGAVAAAAEEERFTRRKHGKRPVAFSAWEQPLPPPAGASRKAGSVPPRST
jgi:predicted NodU family carbamoyl transferase